MKYKFNNEGFIRLVHLLLIGLLLLILIPLTQPYYRYFMLLWHTNNSIKLNAGNMTTMRKEIMAYAKEKKVPLLDRNLIISTEDTTVKVKLYWTDSIDYYGYYQKPLKFVINDEY